MLPAPCFNIWGRLAMFSNIYDIVFCRKRQERKTGSLQGLVLHRRHAQAAEKNVQTDYVCSGAQGAPCKLQVWWHYRRPHPPCRGAACRSRRCTGAINKLPLKWQILPICHCEEAGGRRGNLAVPCWITGKASAKTQPAAGDCHGPVEASQ